MNMFAKSQIYTLLKLGCTTSDPANWRIAGTLAISQGQYLPVMFYQGYVHFYTKIVKVKVVVKWLSIVGKIIDFY